MMSRIAEENEELNIWIIRYSDGRLRSCLGSRREAEETAERESGGCSYEIH